MVRFLKDKYHWTQQTLDNIEWELHASFIQKQTYSRKKTTIKYIHRWLLSGSKRFGQNLSCPHCEGDGKKHDHDHFLAYEFTIDRKEARMKAITDKLQLLLTPKEICDGIHQGIMYYYNNIMQKKRKQSNNTSIDAQDIIRWNSAEVECPRS